MTVPTATAGPPPTPGFRFFDDQNIHTELRDSAAFRGIMHEALSRFTPATRQAAVVHAATIAAGLINQDAAKLLVMGWSKTGALLRAGRDTQARPDSVELVELARQRITATQSPSVDIVVDGSRVATVQLRLWIEFNIEALSASVRAGRLVALHSGHCQVNATLAIQDVVIISRREEVQLPLVMHLPGAGIPLTSSTEHTTPPLGPRFGGQSGRPPIASTDAWPG